jgi:hypothetical protein
MKIFNSILATASLMLGSVATFAQKTTTPNVPNLYNPGILFLSVATALAGWALLIYMAKPRWEAVEGSNGYIKGLISVHLFRFIGLVALVPSIVDPTPFGWTHDYLLQIGFGDWVANVLGIFAIVAISKKWQSAKFFTWAFLIEGTLDTMWAGGKIIPSITDQNFMNTMGWFIVVVYVPALIVTEFLLWVQLLKKQQ